MMLALDAQAVPLKTQLEWPIYDADGTLLYPLGAMIGRDIERNFLFAHFKPHRPTLPAEAGPTPADDTLPAGESDSDFLQHDPIALDDINLTIGASLGIRPVVGGYEAMRQAWLIGYTRDHLLYVTPPATPDPAAQFTIGEALELMVIADQGVFHFTSTVLSVEWHPSPCMVLSAPEKIRRLRMRQSPRTTARLAVHYDTGAGQDQDTYDRLGLATSVSAGGISLEAPWDIGPIGTRLRLSFTLKSDQLELPVETTGVIRYIHSGERPWEPSVHGIELDQLSSNQRTNLKAYAFDQQSSSI